MQRNLSVRHCCRKKPDQLQRETLEDNGINNTGTNLTRTTIMDNKRAAETALKLAFPLILTSHHRGAGQNPVGQARKG